ncbi:hypothetical protein GCM10022397_25670 [Flavivirga jejuensis]
MKYRAYGKTSYPIKLKRRRFLQEDRFSISFYNPEEFKRADLVAFFKIGTKYMYASEDAEMVSDLLRKEKIQIKSNKGYYITIYK